MLDFGAGEAVQSAARRRICMKDNYDFSDSIQNPYFHKLKKQEAGNIDEEIISYFKARAAESRTQTLTNQFLTKYVSEQTSPSFR